jgi:hypothetical protein
MSVPIQCCYRRDKVTNKHTGRFNDNVKHLAPLGQQIIAARSACHIRLRQFLGKHPIPILMITANRCRYTSKCCSYSAKSANPLKSHWTAHSPSTTTRAASLPHAGLSEIHTSRSSSTSSRGGTESASTLPRRKFHRAIHLFQRMLHT